jgi:GAF domain-containing protein
MKLRTWAQLSPDELKRRRAVLKPILIVEVIGLMIGGAASAIVLLTAPAGAGGESIWPPFVLAGTCVLVYRLSVRHWYPAMYLYLFSTLVLNIYGMYTFGGAQGPMLGFFGFIVLAAAMLIDLRAGIEWTILSLITYGVFALGVPLGWIKLPLEMFESSQLFVFPAFFTVSLVALSALFQLFGRSLYQALEQSRRLTKDLEKTAEELNDKNRLSEEANRRLQVMVDAEQQHTRLLEAATVEVDRAAQRARALYQASQQISHLEANLSQTLGDTLRSASTSLGFNSWWLATLDDRGEQLTPMASSVALSEPIDIARRPDSPLARSVLHGETVVVNDPAANPHDERPLPGFGKYVTVPIVSRGQNIGALVFGYPGDGPDLTENEIDIANSLASLAAIAIENNRLFDQSQIALRRLDAINRQLTGESWAAVSRRRGAGSALWISASAEAGQESPPEVAEALRTGKVTSRPIEDAEQLGVAIPLQLRGTAIGALWLAVPRNNWDDEMKTTLTSVAGHAAMAAENARLLEETQRTAQREKAIAGAADKIHRSTDLDTVLRAAVAEINRITGLGGVSVQLGFGQSEPADGNGHTPGTDGGK